MEKPEEILKQRIAEKKKELQINGRDYLEEELDLESCRMLIEKAMARSKEGWYLESYCSIKGNGILGKIKAVFKKIQQKAIYWYAKPLCDAQSAYNKELMYGIEALGNFAEAQMRKNELLEKRIEALEQEREQRNEKG